MAISYCRCTRLPNVAGRRDYISNDKRQEYLEGFYDTMDKESWAQLGKENQAAFESAKKKGFMTKNQKKCIEAREYVIHLPHDLEKKVGSQQLAMMISNYIKSEYGAENCVAIHWNKAKTNYHAHIIVSERERLKEPQRASRNMYYNAYWKRCKKAEAVHTVKKGDITRCFAKGKDPRFKQKSWLEKDLKPKLATLVGLDVYKDDGLHFPFQKVGKGLPPDLEKRILEANNKIAQWNCFVDALQHTRADFWELKAQMRWIKRDKIKWRNDIDKLLEGAIDSYGTSLESLWSQQHKQMASVEKLESQEFECMKRIQSLGNEKTSLDIYARGKPFQALANAPKKVAINKEIEREEFELGSVRTSLDASKKALNATQAKIQRRAPELWSFAYIHQWLHLSLSKLWDLFAKEKERQQRYDKHDYRHTGKEHYDHLLQHERNKQSIRTVDSKDKSK